MQLAYLIKSPEWHNLIGVLMQNKGTALYDLQIVLPIVAHEHRMVQAP